MGRISQTLLTTVVAIYCCVVDCHAQEIDPFEVGFPLRGEAVAGWERDDIPSLWYEQSTGVLKLFAPVRTGVQLPLHGFSVFTSARAFRSDIQLSDVPALSGPFDDLTPTSMSKNQAALPFTDVAFGPIMLPDLTSDFFLDSVAISAGFSEVSFREPFDFVVSTVDRPRPAPSLQEYVPPNRVAAPGVLLSGDADRDGDFDQYDVIRAISSGKFATGAEATWGEGDWDGGPGDRDEPPLGNGVFDRFDIFVSTNTGTYRTGPYDQQRESDLRISSPIQCCGTEGDDRASVVYDPGTGQVSVDSPLGADSLMTLNVESARGIFTGDAIPDVLLGGVFDLDEDHTLFKARFGGNQGGPFGSFSFGNVAQPGLSLDFLLDDLSVSGSAAGGGLLESVDLIFLGPTPSVLMPGDANRDLSFDSLDLVQVLQAGKYLSDQAATWGEGDWDGAPGGSPTEPPQGDGRFNQLDIVAAQQGGVYLTGPYAALDPNGKVNDARTSIVYDVATGEIAVDAPAGTELTSINIDSAAGIFTGAAAENLGGSFDNDAENNIFKATFGSSFGSISFGNVAQSGLTEDFLLGDLSVIGSLQGGGDLGNVDLIYVSEPSTAVLVGLSLAALIFRGRSRRVTD